MRHFDSDSFLKVLIDVIAEELGEEVIHDSMQTLLGMIIKSGLTVAFGPLSYTVQMANLVPWAMRVGVKAQARHREICGLAYTVTPCGRRAYELNAVDTLAVATFPIPLPERTIVSLEKPATSTALALRPPQLYPSGGVFEALRRAQYLDDALLNEYGLARPRARCDSRHPARSDATSDPFVDLNRPNRCAPPYRGLAWCDSCRSWVFDERWTGGFGSDVPKNKRNDFKHRRGYPCAQTTV